MAEVRKKIIDDKYNTSKIKTSDMKKTSKSKKSNTVKKELTPEKNKSFWVKFKIFCHGVRSEFDKVHWPSKENMLKYSVATVVFIVLCSGFFYLIDIIFALIQTLFN